MTIFIILCTSHNATNDDARYRDIVSHLDDDDDVTRFYQLYSQLHTASMHLNNY